jgi:hypothetical protein
VKRGRTVQTLSRGTLLLAFALFFLVSCAAVLDFDAFDTSKANAIAQNGGGEGGTADVSFIRRSGFAFEPILPVSIRRGERALLPIPIDPRDSNQGVELTFELPSGISVVGLVGAPDDGGATTMTTTTTPVVNPRDPNIVVALSASPATSLGSFPAIIKGRQRSLSAPQTTDGGDSVTTDTYVSEEFQFTIVVEQTKFDHSYGPAGGDGLFTSDEGEQAFAFTEDAEGHAIVGVHRTSGDGGGLDSVRIYRDLDGNGHFRNIGDATTTNLGKDCRDLVSHPITSNIILLCGYALHVYSAGGLLRWSHQIESLMKPDRILLLSDGRMLIAGPSTELDSQFVFDRRLSSGASDPNGRAIMLTFDPNYSRATENVADDGIVLIGSGDEKRGEVSRYNLNGSADQTFGGGTGLVRMNSTPGFGLIGGVAIPREGGQTTPQLPSALLYGIVGKEGSTRTPHALFAVTRNGLPDPAYGQDGIAIHEDDELSKLSPTPIVALDRRRRRLYANLVSAEAQTNITLASYDLVDGRMTPSFGNVASGAGAGAGAGAGLFDSDLFNMGQPAFMRVDSTGRILLLGMSDAKWYVARVNP